MTIADKTYELSIIIVSFNTRSLLKNCIDSIIKYLSGIIHFEAIIIDNFSSDGSVELIMDYSFKHPNIRARYLKENTGFANANIVGIEVSSAPVILLLNSDTYLIDDSLEKIWRYLLKQTKLFGVGCMLLKGNRQPGVSYGEFPDFKTVWLEFIFNQYGRRRGRIPAINEGIHSIDFPCGAFFLMKKDLYYEIGGLDKSFFMYFEETDLAKRAWKTGYEIHYYPETKIVHLGGGSGEFSFGAKRIFYKSWKYYLIKHESLGKRTLLKYVVYIHFFIQILKSVVKLNKNNLLKNWQDIRAIYSSLN